MPLKAVQTRTYIGLAGIAALFVLVNIFSNQMLGGIRVDLTEEKLYTLSKSSRAIVKNIDVPLTMKYYFSATDGADFPAFRTYGERVRDLLESYSRLSPKLRLKIYDPRPDTEQAEWAENYGLSPVQVVTGDVLYCGLVLQSETGEEAVIPYFDASREEFLEYDISKAITSVVQTEKPLIGLYSPLPLQGAPSPMFPPGSGGENEPWYFTRDLEEIYDIKNLDTLEALDPGINLLILIHPASLSPAEQYAFDQYLLSGKNAVILTDPLCENAPGASPARNPMMPANRSSSLPDTLRKAGLRMPDGKLILDRERAAQVQTAPGQITDYYAWLELTGSDTLDQNPVTGKLETLFFPTPGYFEYTPAESAPKLEVSALVQSSATASSGDAALLMFGAPPGDVNEAYQPGDKRRPIVISVFGTFKTAFPDGLPEQEDAEEDSENGNATPSSEAPEPLTESTNPSRLILIADADFLSNRFSLNITRLFGNLLLSPMNDNLNLFFNALESLTGSTSLTGIRSRGTFSRPFTRVKHIEARAQAKWRAEERALLQKVDEVNRRLAELMQPGEDVPRIADETIMQEIEKFRGEKRAAQQRLREVRKNLRLEKERLGTQLFLINTLLVPVLICFYGLYRLLCSRKTPSAEN